jgi:TP901 family phage tail tape measure protein
MIEVMTIVKETEGTLEGLTKKVMEMSRASGFDAGAMAKATKIAISTDINPAEIGGFMNEAMRLAISDGSDVEPVVRLMATLRKAFDLPMEALSPLRDVLFTAVDEGAVEIQDLATQLGKISPLAREAGIDMIEMMSAISAVSLGGFTPHQTITNFRNALTDLLDPTSKAQKAMRDLGINFSPAIIKAQGLRGAIDQLKIAMKKDPRALGDLAEDLRSLTFWLSIAGPQLDDYDRIMKEVIESTGKNDKAYQKMIDGPMKKLERLWAGIKTAAIESSDGIMDALFRMVGAQNSVAAAQIRLTSWIKQGQMAVMIFMQVFQEMWFGIQSIFILWKAEWGELVNIIKLGAAGAAQAFSKIIMALTSGLADLFGAASFAAGKLGMKGMEESLASVEKKMRIVNAVMDNMNAEALRDTTEYWDKMGASMGEALDKVALLRKTMGIEESRTAIQELAHDIADLKFEAKNLDDLRFDPANMMSPGGDVSMLAGKRDPAALVEAERYNDLIRFTAQALKDVKRERKERKSSYSQDMQDWKKLLSGKTKAYREHTKALEQLAKKQAAFNRSVNESIFSLEQQDRTPKQQMKAVTEMALAYEKLANTASKAGNLEEVQKNVSSAMDKWKSIAEIAPSKASREMAIEHLKRLQTEMNAVFNKEKAGREKAAKEAKAGMDQAVSAMAKLKIDHDAWLLKAKNIVELWEDMGRVSMEKLVELESKIHELMGTDTVMVIDANIAPAMTKIQALKMAVNGIPITVTGQYAQTGLPVSTPVERTVVPTRSSQQSPMEGAGPKKMAIAPAAGGTSLNMGDINIEYHSTGKTDADARRLAKQIRRHVRRGEVEALGR